MDDRWSKGYLAFPFIPQFENFNLKEAHDTYRVYLNGDYIGEKILLTPTEDVKDVERFLKDRGYKNIATQIDGNVLNIVADSTVAEEIKNNLNVFLNLR